MRVVLCSRRDTPASLATRRSEGRLREVRADRLRFSIDETSALLGRRGVRLGSAQVAAVHAGIAGWPAGVRLVSSALRRQADPGGFLERLAANVQPVADFLIGEVLALLPPDDRDLLATVGAGAAVAAATAAQLSGRSDAYAALDRLAEESGLVYRESANRLRVHPLVPYHLGDGWPRPEAQAPDLPAHVPPRPTAAADPLTLARRAVRYDDAGTLRDIAERHAGILLVTDGPGVLGEVLARLDDDVVASDPWLSLCLTLTRIERGLAAPAVPAVGFDPRESGDRERHAVLRSVSDLFTAAATGDLSVVPAVVDVEKSRQDSAEWAALSLVAAAGRSMLVDADPAAAIAELKEALALARTHAFGYLEMQCLGLLGSVSGIVGDYSAMTAAATGADTAASLGGWDAAPLPTAARWMLAYGALMRGEPVAAHRLVSEALRWGGSAHQPRFAFALRSVQGAALFDAGQRRRGLQKMQRARSNLGSLHLSDQEAAGPALIEHRASMALGDAVAAGQVEAWLSERVGVRGEVLLMRAWSEQSAGRHRAARDAVQPVLDGTATSLLPHTLVEALLVEAMGRLCGGDIQTARRALGDALASGAALGVVRPFTTTGRHTRDFLDHHLSREGTGQHTAARALVAALSPSKSQPSRPAPLDEVELRLLARLPSALSVDQIAMQLHLSPTAVSTRIRTVYRKLGVSSRRTAVVVAYEYGLLR